MIPKMRNVWIYTKLHAVKRFQLDFKIGIRTSNFKLCLLCKEMIGKVKEIKGHDSKLKGNRMIRNVATIICFLPSRRPTSFHV